MALSMCALVLCVGAAAPKKFAAISLFEPTVFEENLRMQLGNPSKHPANPLFVQDKPWESRIDNGYPNIVPPLDGLAGYQLWYGNQAFDGHRHRYSLLYANSTDGIHWEKPDLGIFDFRAAGFPALAKYGSANNVIVEADGVGVYYDVQEPDPSRRYKAVGDACFLSDTLAWNGPGHTCDDLYGLPWPGKDANEPQTRPRFHGIIASSADGLVFPRKTHVENISFAPPQKWDTHNNVFFDEVGQTYVFTTRSVPEEKTGLERETSLTRSIGPRFEFDTSKAPPVIQRGNIDHQTYAQVTFPWLNLYLGLVMVFDQDTHDQVHCRLTFAAKPEGPWQLVEGQDVIDAPDFLPLGKDPKAFDSHVIFAAARPFRLHDRENIYYMGGNGPHDGARNSSLGLATLRPDGFACVSGHGTFITRSLTISDATLTATVDFGGARGGVLRIGVLPDDEKPPFSLSLNNSVPITANGTDTPMRWHLHPELTALLGKTVKLEVSLEGDVMLYALGFAPR